MLLAEEALYRLALDEILLVPTGVAAHKRIDPEPGAALRRELAEIAVEGVERIAVSGLEVERESPSFAYRTLELLHEIQPGSELTFVMGADVAASLESWERPRRVLELADVAVAARPGTDITRVDAALGRLGSPPARVIEMPVVEISSTLIRERLSAERPVRWMVPDRVLALIEARGLYGCREV